MTVIEMLTILLKCLWGRQENRYLISFNSVFVVCLVRKYGSRIE
jgi:hypothetical protein